MRTNNTTNKTENNVEEKKGDLVEVKNSVPERAIKLKETLKKTLKVTNLAAMRKQFKALDSELIRSGLYESGEPWTLEEVSYAITIGHREALSEHIDKLKGLDEWNMESGSGKQ